MPRGKAPLTRLGALGREAAAEPSLGAAFAEGGGAPVLGSELAVRWGFKIDSSVPAIAATPTPKINMRRVYSSGVGR